MRRLSRYSIRSLLVLVTLACVVLGWYAMNVRAYRAERAALVWLEEVHGKIRVEIESSDDLRYHPVPDIDAVGFAIMEPISPFGVHRLMGNGGNAFSRVTEASFYARTFDFRLIKALQQFPHLSHVYLDVGYITTADRERIANLLPNVTFEFYLSERPDEPLYSEPNAQAEDEG